MRIIPFDRGFVLIITVVFSSAAGSTGEAVPSVDLKMLPVNRWTRLPAKGDGL